jgi:hypothetical protein
MENQLFDLAVKLSRVASKHVSIDTGFDIYRYAEFTRSGDFAYGFGSRNPYALADFANINFLLPEKLRAPEKLIRLAVERLKGLQDPETGLFYESSHHPIHATACAMAALHRFDVSPKLFAKSLDKYLVWEVLKEELEKVRWDVNPWRDSNVPVGILTILSLTYGRERTTSLRGKFFDWLNENLDEQLGLWRKGQVFSEKGRGYFTHIAAAFHFLFLYDFFDVDFPGPKQLFHQCLGFINDPEIMKFHREPGYIEIDLFYCLTGAGKRFMEQHELRDLVLPFCESYIKGLNQWFVNVRSSDIHKLFGSALMIGEISSLMGGVSGEGRSRFELPLKKAPYV